MANVRPSVRFSAGVVGLCVIVPLLAFWGPIGRGLANAAGDEKPEAAKKADKDDGNADKEDEPEHALQRFMRQKLQASSLILEGLCTEDLDMVTEGAKTLQKMSSEERWRVSNDMMYRRYSTEFISAVEELQNEVKVNDLDGSSMAWVNVTMKCLKCHQWVRNTVIADSLR